MSVDRDEVEASSPDEAAMNYEEGELISEDTHEKSPRFKRFLNQNNLSAPAIFLKNEE